MRDRPGMALRMPLRRAWRSAVRIGGAGVLAVLVGTSGSWAADAPPRAPFAPGVDPAHGAVDRCQRLLGNAVQAWQVTPANVAACEAVRDERSRSANVNAIAAGCWPAIDAIIRDLREAYRQLKTADALRTRPESRPYFEAGRAAAEAASAALPGLRDCVQRVALAGRQAMAGATVPRPFEGRVEQNDAPPPPSTRDRPTYGGVWRGTALDGPPPGIGIAKNQPFTPQMAAEIAAGRCSLIDGGAQDFIGCPGWPRPIRNADLGPVPAVCGNTPAPPFCQATAGRSPVPSTDRAGACPVTVSPATARRLDAGAGEAARTFAAMGRQVDTFQTALGQLVVAKMVGMTRPSTTVPDLLKAANAAVAYVASNDARIETHRRLRAGAVEAVEFARRNPAVVLAFIAVDRVTPTPRLPGAANCATRTREVQQLEKEAAEAEEALRRVRGVVDDQHRSQPPAPGNQACPINPARWKFNCVASAIAHDLQRETGFGWDQSNFNWQRADLRPTWDQYVAQIRGLYADRTFARLDAGRLRAQSEGRFWRSTRPYLEREMIDGGEGSRALVVVTWAQGGDTHMFNAEVVGGRVRYYDAQGDFDGIANFMKAVPQIEYYRTR